MGFHKPKNARSQEPSGFTPRSSGPASERARQQGWQTDQEERTREPESRQNVDGGTDYDYGARDFGDMPVDTSSAQPSHVAKPEHLKREKKTSTPSSKKAA